MPQVLSFYLDLLRVVLPVDERLGVHLLVDSFLHVVRFVNALLPLLDLCASSHNAARCGGIH